MATTNFGFLHLGLGFGLWEVEGPVAHVPPVASLETHFRQRADVLHPHRLMEPDAWLVGKGDASDQGTQPSRAARLEQAFIERFASSSSLMLRPDINPNFCRPLIGTTLLPRVGTSKSDDFVIGNGYEPRHAGSCERSAYLGGRDRFGPEMREAVLYLMVIDSGDGVRVFGGRLDDAQLGA